MSVVRLVIAVVVLMQSVFELIAGMTTALYVNPHLTSAAICAALVFVLVSRERR